MKYYEMHDEVYRKLKGDGFVSWDKDRDLGTLRENSMNLSLLNHLADQNLSLSHLTVLDLGTGAGACALYCAQEGAKVTGVDVSINAISMARENAETLKLKVEFQADDILVLDLSQRFDLITDSSLLHCLIGPDRKRFYQTVTKHLKKDGHLFIHTMVESSDMARMVDPKYFVFEAPVLWSLGFSPIEQGRKTFDEKSYFPHRTILTEERLLSELKGEGFILLSKSTRGTQGNPATFTGLFKLPDY